MEFCRGPSNLHKSLIINALCIHQEVYPLGNALMQKCEKSCINVLAQVAEYA
jgi:hypothetical protein